MKRRHLVQCVLTLCVFAACGALGQPFPSKPIHLIVPFAVGGANDLNGRSLQIPLSQALGGTVIVENIVGASTKLAVERLMKAAPDGHTLLLAGHGALMGYYYSGIFETRFWENMVILGQTGRMPWIAIEARADAPFKTWAELVDYAKKNPGKINAGGRRWAG